MATSLIK